MKLRCEVTWILSWKLLVVSVSKHFQTSWIKLDASLMPQSCKEKWLCQAKTQRDSKLTVLFDWVRIPDRIAWRVFYKWVYHKLVLGLWFLNAKTHDFERYWQVNVTLCNFNKTDGLILVLQQCGLHPFFFHSCDSLSSTTCLHFHSFIYSKY